MVEAINAMEMLGFLKGGRDVRLFQKMVNPTTPGNLKAILHILRADLRGHNEKVEGILQGLSCIPDSVLTYGTFLAICEKLTHAQTKEG
jgi:hypothetical protein